MSLNHVTKIGASASGGVDASGATDGQVLTADGAGGSAFENNPAASAASTSAAGVVELATAAESATKGSAGVMTPDLAMLMPHFSQVFDIVGFSTTATNGTGAVAGTFNNTIQLGFTSSSPDGAYAYVWGEETYTRPAMGQSNNESLQGLHWDNRVVFSCFVNVSQNLWTGDGETIYIDLGSQAGDQGNLSGKGIGFRLTGNTIYGVAHDGTTLSVSTNTATMPYRATGHLMVISDGSGNVSWYVDGTELESVSSIGPTGNATTSHSAPRYGVLQTGARTKNLQFLNFSNPIISILK